MTARDLNPARQQIAEELGEPGEQGEQIGRKPGRRWPLGSARMTLGWLADLLRRSGNSVEDRFVGGGRSVLKYTFGGFVVNAAKLLAEQSQTGDPEDARVYRAAGILRESPEGCRGLGRADMIGRSVM